MKVVAYCLDTDQKILLARANGKRHDITVISNALNFDTVGYASGKSAVILCGENKFDVGLLAPFKSFGVLLIISTFAIENSFLDYARNNFGICIINLASHSINYGNIVRVLDNW